MKNVFSSTGLMIALLLAAAGIGKGAEPATQPASVLLADGPIKGLMAKLNGVIAFVPDGRKLQLDDACWVKRVTAGKAQPERIGIAPGAPGGAVPIMPGGGGGGGGGMMPPNFNQNMKDASALIGPCSTNSSSGNNGISLSGYNDRVSFSLVSNAGGVTFQAREVATPNRQLLFHDDGGGKLGFTFLTQDGDLVVFTQDKSGAVRLVSVHGEEMQSARGDDYRDLCTRQGAMVSAHLTPALAFLGIAMQNPADNPALRAAVLRLLAPVNPDNQKEGERLLTSLDAAEFDTRESATKELDRRYGEFAPAIEAKMKDDTISAETKQRLQTITEAHKDDSKLLAQIDSLDLTNDPAFLVTLLEGADARNKPHVVARLERITGQKLGDDADAWRRWVVTNSRR